MPQPNAYSRRWFTTFLGHIDETIVEREVAFLERQLPRDSYARVLDLCCGPGRHLAPLSARGYTVTGLDRDAAALATARGLTPVGKRSATLAGGDMTALPFGEGSFDAVICLWQSFGYLDADGNRDVLAGMRRVLRPAGQIVLDLYHHDFYAKREGRREMERGPTRVVETRRMHGTRLHVHLSYQARDTGEVGEDDFDWLLYRPNELTELASKIGLATRLACTNFDELRPPSEDEPRMQLVLQDQRATSRAAAR